MRLNSYIVTQLILRKSFKYYSEDEFLVRKVLSFASSEKPRVLDVGCGNGHYSFLFEICGAEVVGFDYNAQLIEENHRKANLNKSCIQFLTVDGNYPERYFTDTTFDIVFMSGFSLFATDISHQLMNKYLKLLSHNGILVFIQNSDQGGNIRKTHIRNYNIDYLKNEFCQLNCNIENVFFYDRHIAGRVLHQYVFSGISTKVHSIFTKLTRIPCNIVLIISQKETK